MKPEKYSGEKLVFELKDLEIFKIKDLKLRLDTLQNYFFPRMDKLLYITLNIARDVYGESICDDITITKSPRHRPATKYDDNDNNDYFGSYVTIGVAGLRNNGNLIIIRKDGKPAKIPPAAIEYEIDSNGKFSVRLLLSRYHYVNNGKNDYFFSGVKKFLKKYNEIIMILFNDEKISYSPYLYDYKPLYDVDSNDVYITSQIYNLPIDNEDIFFNAMNAFTTLMPIWHALVRISRGKETLFEEHIKALKEHNHKTYLTDDSDDEKEDDSDNLQNDSETISDEMKDVIDNLDDYKHIATGKWWQILSRDNWTCCSCGRSSRDGFILHVDHIIPRSKGGNDDISNLQTLCQKCNIGKSNKDQTNLRI